MKIGGGGGEVTHFPEVPFLVGFSAPYMITARRKKYCSTRNRYETPVLHFKVLARTIRVRNTPGSVIYGHYESLPLSQRTYLWNYFSATRFTGEIEQQEEPPNFRLEILPHTVLNIHPQFNLQDRTAFTAGLPNTKTGRF